MTLSLTDTFLVKFPYWNGAWTQLGDAVTLASVGTGWHKLRLTFSNVVGPPAAVQINAYYEDNPNTVISYADSSSDRLTTGGVSLDMWTGGPRAAYTMSADYVVVYP
jgi:hypothetical protein